MTYGGSNANAFGLIVAATSTTIYFSMGHASAFPYAQRHPNYHLHHSCRCSAYTFDILDSNPDIVNSVNTTDVSMFGTNVYYVCSWANTNGEQLLTTKFNNVLKLR